MEDEQKEEETIELPKLETGDSVNLRPEGAEVYVRIPEEIYRAFEYLFKRQSMLNSPEEEEKYERGRQLWRKEGINADFRNLSEIETVGYFDEMDIQTSIRRCGNNIEAWKDEKSWRDWRSRKSKGCMQVVYTNDWSIIDEIKRILERVEPDGKTGYIVLKKSDIILKIVEEVYKGLDDRAKSFLVVFNEYVKREEKRKGE